jgi:D-glycero-D-manno-heptose 1,7-bisphosphate phosphatase
VGIDEVNLKRAVFLDRDGVLNCNVLNPATGEYESPGKAEDFKLCPNVMPALCDLREAGFSLFLVSNQPNFAKGKSTLEDLRAVHSRLVAALQAAGVGFADYYYCFHHPQGKAEGYSGRCECRKPSPYFLMKARDAFGVSLAHSWMVGDRATDIACGIAAGAKTIRVKEDHPATRAANEPKADFEAADLAGAAEIIVGAAVSPINHVSNQSCSP